MDQKRFKTRLQGFKKKAGNLSTLCEVEICFVVFGHGSQTPTAVWPDGDKAENIARRYLRLPPKQQPSCGSSYYDDHQQQLYDCLGGFSEEGLRDVARVLEGKLEEAKRKMEALGTCLPNRWSPSPAGKRAKVVGEGGRTRRITSPAATMNGAVVASNNLRNGTINGELCNCLWEEGLI